MNNILAIVKMHKIAKYKKQFVINTIIIFKKLLIKHAIYKMGQQKKIYFIYFVVKQIVQKSRNTLTLFLTDGYDELNRTILFLELITLLY